MLSKTLKFASNVVSAFNTALFRKVPAPVTLWQSTPGSCASVHSSAVLRDLNEFFDVEDNWNKMEVRVGRPWYKEDLRLKSNSDLHKLWFVLLKERNMLFTMQDLYVGSKPMPSPDRIHRVEESMTNLEEVVRERNRAYFELETGKTGERRSRITTGPLGLRSVRAEVEHSVPIWMNRKWRENNPRYYRGNAVRKFLKLYREKLRKEEFRDRLADKEYVMQLLKYFPKMDMDYLQEKFPEFNIKELRDEKGSRGHWVP